ncbi:MAG: hypothetical protein IPH37_19275 [Burkholderiales bacterium]|nr:hypothetical protein [Burkholderiales bacterium]
MGPQAYAGEGGEQEHHANIDFNAPIRAARWPACAMRIGLALSVGRSVCALRRAVLPKWWKKVELPLRWLRSMV